MDDPLKRKNNYPRIYFSIDGRLMDNPLKQRNNNPRIHFSTDGRNPERIIIQEQLPVNPFQIFVLETRERTRGWKLGRTREEILHNRRRIESGRG